MPCAYVKVNDEDGERAAQGEKTSFSLEKEFRRNYLHFPLFTLPTQLVLYPW